jgi:hypothetical protein
MFEENKSLEIKKYLVTVSQLLDLMQGLGGYPNPG